MKKSVLLMAAATAIALSSCSSEETKDVAKSSNITFRSTVGLNSRGTEATTDNLKNIWVSAWADNDPVFNAEQFTKKAGTTEFRSVGGPWFWEKDKGYTFMAFATGKEDKANLNPTINKDNITLADYTPSANLADQLDLLTAHGTGNKVDNQTTGAKLDFDHILSQIQIKVKNTNENRKYIIKGVRISNVNGTATYTFTPGNAAAKHAWTDLKTPSQYVLNQGVEIALNGQNKDVNDLLVGDNSAMLIPQGITAWDGTVPAGPNATFANVTGSYISLLINIQKKNNGQWEQVYPKADQVDETKFAWAAVAIPAVTWVNGNKYIYTLDLSRGAGKVDPVEPGPDYTAKDPKPGEDILGGEIFFTVSVKQWVDQTTDVPM
jgi:hypothetical protein